MLKVDAIKKSYSDFELNCSFEVQPGYISGIIGPNGGRRLTTKKIIKNE